MPQVEGSFCTPQLSQPCRKFCESRRGAQVRNNNRLTRSFNSSLSYRLEWIDANMVKTEGNPLAAQLPGAEAGYGRVVGSTAQCHTVFAAQTRLLKEVLNIAGDINGDIRFAWLCFVWRGFKVSPLHAEGAHDLMYRQFCHDSYDLGRTSRPAE